jgi:hypothetical protein
MIFEGNFDVFAQKYTFQKLNLYLLVQDNAVHLYFRYLNNGSKFYSNRRMMSLNYSISNSE